MLSTEGTSGVTTYVPFDRASWLSVLAQYQVVHRADAITVAVVERPGGGPGWTDAR